MLARVEPPPPAVLVGWWLSIASEKLVPYALGAWAKQGLRVLADDYEAHGEHGMASWWRCKIADLGKVHIADTQLACCVADGLLDLSRLYATQGCQVLADRWHEWSEFIRARAWQRVRIAHGVG